MREIAFKQFEILEKKIKTTTSPLLKEYYQQVIQDTINLEKKWTNIVYFRQSGFSTFNNLDDVIKRIKELIGLERKNEEVYFIRGANKIKIGFSANIPERFKTIQTHSPVKLEFLFSFKGGFDIEGVIQLYFKKYNSHGEWYIITDQLLELIERLKVLKNEVS